jgi:hypothetical protein
VVKAGKTTVLDAEQARKLSDSIDLATVVGLRDRALISVMSVAFARIGAVVAMRVKDYYPSGVSTQSGSFLDRDTSRATHQTTRRSKRHRPPLLTFRTTARRPSWRSVGGTPGTRRQT